MIDDDNGDDDERKYNNDDDAKGNIGDGNVKSHDDDDGFLSCSEWCLAAWFLYII